MNYITTKLLKKYIDNLEANFKGWDFDNQSNEILITIKEYLYYYKTSLKDFNIPILRDRPNEIECIVNYFQERYEQFYNQQKPTYNTFNKEQKDIFQKLYRIATRQETDRQTSTLYFLKGKASYKKTFVLQYLVIRL